MKPGEEEAKNHEPYREGEGEAISKPSEPPSPLSADLFEIDDLCHGPLGLLLLDLSQGQAGRLRLLGRNQDPDLA